jgi:hypothetical protein
MRKLDMKKTAFYKTVKMAQVHWGAKGSSMSN